MAKNASITVSARHEQQRMTAHRKKYWHQKVALNRSGKEIQMGVTDSNALLAVTARQGKQIDPNKSADVEKSPKFYRPTRNRLEKSLLVEHVTPPDEVESFRIRSMKKELMHYRNTLDQMVHLKTEMLDRRLAILESCNSRLGENYHQMHRMYLDLLIRTQAYEAQTHLHVLEGELAMMNPAQSIEA